MNFAIDQNELRQEIQFDSSQRWWNISTTGLAIEMENRKLPSFVTVKEEILREGLTVPGRAKLSMDDLIEIGEDLDAAGYRELEVGYVAAIAEHREFARRLREKTKLRQMAHTRSWAGDWKTEVDRTVDAGVDMVNLSGFGATETEKFTQPGRRKEELPDLFARQVEYSKSQGIYTIFLLSASTMRQDLADQCYQQVAQAGADRVILGDGYGILTPEATRYLISRIRSIVGDSIEIGLHAHNDFGLGLANGLAAVTAGATAIDGSINGLAARAGITNSVALTAALEVLYGIDTGIKLDKLKSVADKVARKFEIPITPHEPVIGPNIYRHETDIHIAAMLSGNWFSYNVINPDTLGEKVRLQFGPASLATGEMSSVAVKIRKMGKAATDEQVEKVLSAMRDRLAVTPSGFLSESELESIILAVL